jgi:hypothetical protein
MVRELKSMAKFAIMAVAITAYMAALTTVIMATATALGDTAAVVALLAGAVAFWSPTSRCLAGKILD